MADVTPNLFRSEEMAYIRMYIENDTAHDVVSALADVGVIEFKDMNKKVSAFQRSFVTEVKRCEEMQRKLRMFRTCVTEERMPVDEVSTLAGLSLNDAELFLTDREAEIVEANKHYTELTRSHEQRKEQRMVMETCAAMMQQSPGLLEQDTESMENSLLQNEEQRTAGMVGNVSGCMPAGSAATFERIVFRATRGNCYTTFREVEQPDGASHTVFMTFYSGDVVGAKIRKIATAFQASVYEMPELPSERVAMQKVLTRDLKELGEVLKRTTASRLDLLRDTAATLAAYERFVDREKAIYVTMNLFENEVGRRGMVAEGWCPRRDLALAKEALDCTYMSLDDAAPIFNEVPTKKTPPTYFKTNKLTYGFQEIVDAYGVANYQEYNPMPFTVITFPFLFAVMFGDLGHGTLMFLFALAMIALEKHFAKNPPGEIMAICYGGRYVILLMSMFSMYTGLLYNDTFAMSFDFFGSAYDAECLESGHHGCEKYYFPSNYDLVDGARCGGDGPCLPVYRAGADVYPFGLDPVWKQAENELSYTNSLKMKMSIVLGVTQMEFGVLLSGLNAIYFNNQVEFIHVFVPQVIFLTSVFGYMTLVIFVKWATVYTNSHCAPSILSTFIDMFLSFGYVNVEPGCEEYAEFIPFQTAIERLLILMALVSVPWMLLAKPLIEKAHHEAQAAHHELADEEMGSKVDPELDLDHHEDDDDDDDDGHGHGEYDFMEEFVHQIIHTIEFVLGAVSNTASYLRLWALSLAHAQLSTVFWEKVMVDNMGGGPVGIVVGFFVWFLCTMGVLMVMESLSAFLHALRLHWVEFQNKFYTGAGSKFAPVKF